MESIQTIKEGMSMGEVWNIINQLVEAFNKYQGVVAAAVVDGKIDYNAIGNHPVINGMELIGERTLPELGITTDAELVERTNQLDGRMAVMEMAGADLDSRASSLEAFRASDVDRIKALEESRRADMASARDAALSAVKERMELAEARVSNGEAVTQAFVERMAKAEGSISNLTTRADADSAIVEAKASRMNAQVADFESRVADMASAKTLQEFQAATIKCLQQINSSFTANSLTRSDCTDGTCKVIDRFDIPNAASITGI